MAARDVIFIAITLFTVAIGFFVVHYTINTVVSQLIVVEAINESDAAIEAISMSATISNRLDYVIFGLFIALILGLIITGWFIGGNPIFMFIYFIFIIIAVVLSMIFANVWDTVTQSSIFGSTVSHFVLTNNILGNLPIYISIIGLVGLVVMFAKPYIAGEQ